jgi:hypothetical protein
LRLAQSVLAIHNKLGDACLSPQRLNAGANIDGRGDTNLRPLGGTATSPSIVFQKPVVKSK